MKGSRGVAAKGWGSRPPTPEETPVQRILPPLHPLLIAGIGVAVLTAGWLLGLGG